MRKINFLVLAMIFTMLVSVIGVSAEGTLDGEVSSALEYEYSPAYNYVGEVVSTDNGILREYSPYAFLNYGSEPGEAVMHDMARYLGALHRQDNSTIVEIHFEEVVYTWNEEGTLKGSNWEDATGTTLVNSIVHKFHEDPLLRSVDVMVSDGENSLNVTLSFQIQNTLKHEIASAVNYQYIPVYEYGNVILENNVFTGTYTVQEFIAGQPMNDMARFLGALYRQDGSTVVTIEFDNVVYTWNVDGTLKGSNWESNEITLVSVLVSSYETEPGPLTVMISDGINTEEVTFILHVDFIGLINTANSPEYLMYLLTEYNTILEIDLTTYNMLVEGRKTAVGNDLFANKPSEGFGTLEEFVLLFNNLVEFRVAVQEAVEAANDGELTIAHLGNVQVKLSELIDMKVNGQIVTAENLAEGNQFITLLGTLPTGRFSALVTDLAANGPYNSFEEMAMMIHPLAQFRFAVQEAVEAANDGELTIAHLGNVKNAIEPLDGMSLSGEMISYEMANDTIEQFKELSVETQNRILEKVAGEYPSFTHLLLAFPNAALSVALELVNEANNASELKLVVDDIFVYATGSSVENFNALNESEQMAVLSDIIANRPESGFNEVEEVVELFNAIIAIRMESSDVAEVAKASEGNITFNNTGLMLEGIVPNSFAAIEVYEGEVPAGVSSPAPNTLNLYAKITAQVADGNATFRAPIPLEADGYENFQLCRYNANSTWTCHDLEIEGNYFVLRNIEKFSWWALTGTPIPAPEPEQPTTPTGGAGPVFGGFFGSTEPSEQETPVVETPAEPDVPETPQEEVEQQIPETPATETPAAETPAAEMARGGPLTGLVTFAEENRGMFTGFSAIIMIGGILALVYYNTAGKRRYRRRY